MSNLFISHSSRNLKEATSIAEELNRLGHEVWLDEWEIKVGDSIIHKINKGLEECNFIVLLLSEHSVSSKWVEKEWSSAYMDEIESGKVVLLPALLEDCTIPAIMRDKKYADFRESFTYGMIQLTAVLSPTLDVDKKIDKEQVKIVKDMDLQNLIAESQTSLLSDCLAKAIPIAQKYKDPEFLEFCHGELSGWNIKDSEEIRSKGLDYRVAELFFSPFKRINLNAPQWGNSPNAVINFLRNEKDVYPMKYFIPNLISDLEYRMKNEVLSTGILTLEMPIGHMIPEIQEQDANYKMPVYGHPDAVLQILNGVRSKLVSHLISHLPAIQS